jgi:hypothetical protein
MYAIGSLFRLTDRDIRLLMHPAYAQVFGQPLGQNFRLLLTLVYKFIDITSSCIFIETVLSLQTPHPVLLRSHQRSPNPELDLCTDDYLPLLLAFCSAPFMY